MSSAVRDQNGDVHSSSSGAPSTTNSQSQRPSTILPRPHSSSRLLTPTRTRYLLLGLILRFSLLLFGLYQDKHSALPYTDIDYSVFLDGTHHLVHGCPLSAAVPPNADPMQNLLDFQSPPSAPLDGCASGWLSIGARYILQHEDVLVARSKGSKDAEKARKQLGDDAALSLIEPNKFETLLIPLSLGVLRPLLKPLAAMGNPYARPTFRYTPLLAALLSPGAWFGGWLEAAWGKILFVLADVLAAVLMWDIAKLSTSSNTAPPARSTSPLAPSQVLRLLYDSTHSVGLLWLLNPFPAQIATRGSSESLLSFLVLAFAAAAVRLIGNNNNSSQGNAASPNPNARGLPALPHEAILTPLLLAIAVHLKIYPAIYGFSVLAALRTRYMDSTIFLFTALYTFFGLSTLVYLIWGQPYLDHSLLYHVTRIDHRHNFSPYFLPMYLNNVAAQPSGLLPAAPGAPAALASSSSSSFLPQLILVLLIAVKIAPKDILMAFFAQTFVFVLFNKVQTSQYFIWYLHFIPILLPRWKFSSSVMGWIVLAVWVASQAAWLASAYMLEFQGKDVFLQTWVAGLVYVIAQGWVFERCLDAWSRGRRRSQAAEDEERKRQKQQ